jgi:nitrogen fixation protein NifU and related proteins
MQYSSKVLEHFAHPHNQGKMENPDAIGEVGNIRCGDIMKLYLKIKDNKIEDIKFETLGCAAAIATTSILTDLAKGKSLDEALKITREDIVNELGGLPTIKIHCSVLATEALEKAIEEYRKK